MRYNKINKSKGILKKNKDIQHNNGKALLQHNKGSHVDLITNFYPNYKWLLWKFVSVPQNFWKDKENHRKCLDYLAKEMNIKVIDDWYNISIKVRYFCK